MKVGELYYRRIGIEIEEVEIISINFSNDRQTINVIYHSKITGVTQSSRQNTFNTYYTISKINLLRGIILDLDKRMMEVLIEINEYDLKMILSKYNGRPTNNK